MGRKIPGKKHRHVVDPEKQRAKRLESIKDKINNPPQNPDEQEMPRSVQRIMQLKKKAAAPRVMKINKKSKKIRKKKRKDDKALSVEMFLDKEEKLPGMKPDKYIPNLTQRPNETPEKFLGRVNFMTQNIIKEHQFEDKFKVSIQKDPETGRVLKVERKSDDVRKKTSKKKKLAQKRKEKKLLKAEENTFRDFSELKDKVEFGEVVHRPPVNLKLGKNKKDIEVVKKGDKYKNLLLKEMMSSDEVNKKLELERQEKQRQFFVNAYRERKKLGVMSV